MADYITKIRTEDGDKQIDYNALANLPKSDAALIKSGAFADAKAVGDAINKKADKTSVPTKLSQLTDDVGFLKAIPDEYVTTSELSEQGYVTETILTGNGYVTENFLETNGYLTQVPTASGDVVGGIKPGDDFVVSEDGTLNLAPDAGVTWDGIIDKPSTFVPAVHSHVLSDVKNIVVCDSTPTEIINGYWYLVKVEV